MDYFLNLGWSNAFAPQQTLPELVTRGTVVYLGLLVLLRVVPKREAGTGTVASMLFVVLVGGTAVNGLAGRSESLTDTMLLVLTVMLWAFAVDWLSYRYPRFRHLVQEPPTCLVRDGRLLEANLRREMISEEDLKTHLRRQDVDDIGGVLAAELEADGSISVVTKKPSTGSAGPTTSPSEEAGACGACRPGGRGGTAPPGDRHERNGRPPARSDGTPAGGRAGADDGIPPDEPELREFLAAARRLQGKLGWHQQQVARLKEALARYGVRVKPAPAGRADEADPGGRHPTEARPADGWGRPDHDLRPAS